MIPNCNTQEDLERLIPQDQRGADAERYLYNFMKNNLPPNWNVFYNRHLGSAYNDHQIDFLVFVPGKGIVNVDAKGRGYSITDGDFFLEKRENGVVIERKRKDIIAEAKGAIYRFNDHYTNILNTRWGAFSWLIVFCYNDFPGLENHPVAGNILQQGNLSHLEEAINSVLNYHAEAFPYFTPDKAQKILASLSLTTSGIVHNAKYLDNDNKLNTCLTAQQQICLNEILAHRYTYIRGSAGTGKTLIALACAQEYAKMNKRVLYVCFNKALAEHLASDNYNPLITILSYFQLPRYYYDNCDYAKRYNLLNEQLRNNPNTDNDYWLQLEDVFLAFLKEPSVQLKPKFDLLLVDEAQDFTSKQYDLLRRLLKRDHKIAWFSDAGQNIYTPDWRPPTDLKLDEKVFTPPPLNLNLRNAANIFESFRELSLEETMPQLLVNGEITENLPFSNYMPIVDELLEKRYHGKQDIAILSNAKDLLPTDPNRFTSEVRIWKQGTKVLATTIHAFKGLEANCVFLLLQNGKRNYAELEYIGRSRAKYRLYVIKS